MIEIVPAIMPDSLKDLKSKMGEVRGLVSTVQIDVMDGVFVPPKTWPYINSEGFEDIVSGREDMPFLNELEFEVDLMVSDQEKEVLDWIKAGARRVVGHVEAMEDIDRFIKTARDATVPSDSFLSAEVGLSLDINTSVDLLIPHIRDVDFVQFMGIARIGYQGEEFDERVLERVSSFRKNFPDLVISVDGGVSEDSASLLIEAGVNRLVSGSAFFESNDKEEIVKRLSNTA